MKNLLGARARVTQSIPLFRFVGGRYSETKTQADDDSRLRMNSREWLCLWYLRLNGDFTLPNFYAHGRRGPLTEVDVLGVRFPLSREFDDDPALAIPLNALMLCSLRQKQNRSTR